MKSKYLMVALALSVNSSFAAKIGVLKNGVNVKCNGQFTIDLDVEGVFGGYACQFHANAFVVLEFQRHAVVVEVELGPLVVVFHGVNELFPRHQLLVATTVECAEQVMIDGHLCAVVLYQPGVDDAGLISSVLLVLKGDAAYAAS